MRNFKLFILSLFIGASAMAATPVDNEETNAKLQKQVTEYLGKHNIDTKEDINAKLTFMVTPQDEIVVLRVVSENEDAERFIKRKLNYQTVKKAQNVRNKTYTMKVLIESDK